MRRTNKKKLEVDAHIAMLRAIESHSRSPKSREIVRTGLRSPSFLVAACAARIVRDQALEGMAADLEATFRRFLSGPATDDPGCQAKVATIEALDYAEHRDAQPFLDATSYFQFEAAWGPPVDTAVGLRARGVLALGRLDYSDLSIVAGTLLADPASAVRQAAAEALAASHHRNVAGLLLLRWRMGDDDPLVIMACMNALVSIAPDEAMPRLRSALFSTDQDHSEAAGLALAQSSREDALDVLLEHLQQAPDAAGRTRSLRFVALHRSDRALDAMLEVIAKSNHADAAVAIAALAPRRFDPGVRERAQQAARVNASGHLEAALRAAFPQE